MERREGSGDNFGRGREGGKAEMRQLKKRIKLTNKRGKWLDLKREEERVELSGAKKSQSIAGWLKSTTTRRRRRTGSTTKGQQQEREKGREGGSAKRRDEKVKKEGKKQRTFEVFG
jgi:hypothetical protein